MQVLGYLRCHSPTWRSRNRRFCPRLFFACGTPACGHPEREKEQPKAMGNTERNSKQTERSNKNRGSTPFCGFPTTPLIVPVLLSFLNNTPTKFRNVLHSALMRLHLRCSFEKNTSMPHADTCPQWEWGEVQVADIEYLEGQHHQADKKRQIAEPGGVPHLGQWMQRRRVCLSLCTGRHRRKVAPRFPHSRPQARIC